MGGTVGALIGQASGVAAFISVILGAAYIRSQNRKNNADAAAREAEARKSGNEGGKFDAEAHKLGVEGEVAMSGTAIEWARDYRAEAKEAKAEAKQASADVRTAVQRADELQRDFDNCLESLNDLRREFDQLLERIAACPAGTICPVADSLTSRHRH